MNKILLVSITLALVFAINASAEDFAAKCQAAMSDLKEKLVANGNPRLEGKGKISGKEAPNLYFGNQKITKNFKIVDNIKKIHGGTATVFVKTGDEFLRISTNVMKDGESRAIGTFLARNKAYEAIIKGQTFSGQVEILGNPYETRYEPIKDQNGEIVGIYYVGFPIK